MPSGAAGRPALRTEFPPPDEQVVEPETYQEMIDDQIIQVAPSGPPHADRQFDIAYVLRANVADGYIGSTELLTTTTLQLTRAFANRSLGAMVTSIS